MSFTGTPFEITQWLGQQDQTKRYTIKEIRPKRSLTANAYYWVLVNKLARQLHLSDTEVHKWILRDYGVCSVVSLRSDVRLEDYFKYFETFATAYMNGAEYVHVRVYKESKKMDSQEFSRLLEGIRYECEQQGVEVMTPSEIAQLKFIETYGEDK